MAVDASEFICGGYAFEIGGLVQDVETTKGIVDLRAGELVAGVDKLDLQRPAFVESSFCQTVGFPCAGGLIGQGLQCFDGRLVIIDHDLFFQSHLLG